MTDGAGDWARYASIPRCKRRIAARSRHHRLVTLRNGMSSGGDRETAKNREHNGRQPRLRMRHDDWAKAHPLAKLAHYMWMRASVPE